MMEGFCKFLFIYVILLALVTIFSGVAAFGGASFWLVFIAGAVIALVVSLAIVQD